MEFVPLILFVIVLAAIAWGAWKLKDRFAILGEFLLFLKERKLWWIAPILIVFLLAGLFVAITSQSAIGAFIYTLF